MKRSHAGPLVAGLIVLAATGCRDERVVFRDRELFTPPQAAAMGFLGYSDTARSLPVCGNCHVEPNSRWRQTAHADAWNTIATNPGMRDSCQPCHSVNERGNPVTGSAGFTAVADARYHDVQCESCHGPGLAHVENPDGEPKPYAPLRVDTALTAGCGECHTGTHHPFVQEWRVSAHGAVPHQASPGGRTECQGCHTGEDALREWGFNVDYLEKDSVNQTGRHLPITCGVCHDPHSAANEAQLRFAVDIPSEENNLCMKCHHKRGTPDQTTFRGPHSPEGPVLLGYGGWWPPNMQLPGGDTIFATHGSERNPKLCAGCHLVRFAVNDPQSGNFQFQATGHLFLATPCLNAQGIPQPGDCPDNQRTYRTCTGAGCHGSENVARSLQATAELRIELLAGTVDNLLRQIHPNWAQCRTNNSCGAGSPFNSADGTFSTAEGAAFNRELALYPGSVVHNPFLVEALLTGSINQLRKDYNVTVPSSIDLRNILSGH